MPATIIIGAQWGDEGKGSTVDRLAATAHVVARFGGGDNAGHTINIGKDVFKLHLVPSGILRDNVTCVLGNGMVINPIRLIDEIDGLAKLGVDVSPERIYISTRAHLITPAHRALDAAHEKSLGSGAIGTTLRGIGPAYNDKTGRRGVRAGLMADVELLAEALQASIREANVMLQRYDMDALDPEKDTQQFVDAAARLRPYLRDTAQYLNQQLKAGAHVLCEGAQGALLDVDHGSYPYVTSSSTTTGGA
jgi:adenylosuccinate synthase